MHPEEIRGHIDKLRQREAELAAQLADPALYAKVDECRRVGAEHRKLERKIASYFKSRKGKRLWQ